MVAKTENNADILADFSVIVLLRISAAMAESGERLTPTNLLPHIKDQGRMLQTKTAVSKNTRRLLKSICHHDAVQYRTLTAGLKARLTCEAKAWDNVVKIGISSKQTAPGKQKS